MENFIIIAIVAILAIIGIRACMKHFKGQGGCCGSGSAPAPKQDKKLEHVIRQKIVIIDGMTCDHCKAWVEKSINDIDGAAAKVNLLKKEAIVSMEREVSDDEIRAAVAKAGFKVVEIR